MIIVIADVDEVAALLGVTVQRDPEIVRPQESGPCVHYDERSEHVADVAPCTYPYDDGRCPHLDNPAILCPVKDACSAMQEIARMRDACEAEQEEKDADMAAQDAVYETETPEFVEPEPDEGAPYESPAPTPAKRKDAWTEDETWIVARADTEKEAITSYRGRFPLSTRTDVAIKSRWRKLYAERGAQPVPDFPGDTAPVTQCDEAAIRRPRYKAGDKVRITDPALPDCTGTIRRYYAATENYLLTIDGTHDTIRLPETRLEAL